MVLPVQALALALLRAVVVALAVQVVRAFDVAAAVGCWVVLVEHMAVVVALVATHAAAAARCELFGPGLLVNFLRPVPATYDKCACSPYYCCCYWQGRPRKMCTGVSGGRGQVMYLTAR